MNIIKQILAKLACCHEWDLHRRIETFAVDNGIQIGARPMQTTDTLICKKCGKIRKIKLGI